MTYANCASVAWPHVITVHCDSGACRHKVCDSLIGNSINYASHTGKRTRPIPIDNVHMYLWHCASMAHFI